MEQLEKKDVVVPADKTDVAEEKVGKGLALFERTFSLALHTPGVKVNRQKFLTHQLKSFVSEDQLGLISTARPYELVNRIVLDKIADATIKNHTMAVVALSAASGAPANPAVAVGLASADIVQYFAQVLILCQKVAYTYGFPDLLDEDENFTEVSKQMLLVLFAVAMGCKLGSQKIGLMLRALAKGVEKKLPQQAERHARKRRHERRQPRLGCSENARDELLDIRRFAQRRTLGGRHRILWRQAQQAEITETL